ncbi:MAG: VWA domain-containing protein [Holophagales bacterium]|nr:VWA domain-containing protein [Holophagales bacterium]MYC08878.1 VWA domain-containing protein [Holophagales bacterium]
MTRNDENGRNRLRSLRSASTWLTASVLGLLIAPSTAPALAQEAAPQHTSVATVVDDPVAAIPGIWVRDEKLSEDPIEKLEETYGQTFGGGPGRSPGANPGSGRTGGFGRGGQGGSGRGGFGGGRTGRQPGATQDGPSGMREMARELAERLDVLLIRIDDPQLLIRNAKREDRILYLDGRDIADGFGGRSRARLLGDSLEVETASQGRQRIETFYLEGDRLVLVTDLQGGRFADLSFRTVYERSGDAPAVPVPASTRRASEAAAEPDEDGFNKADFLPPVEGGRGGRRPERADSARSARPATIRILPPERGYRELLTGRIVIQTLTIDPQIAVVEFLLDGEPAARVTTPPFEARIRLADPPREQTIEVRATSARGAHAGTDRIVLNRLDPPFAVRIAGITAGDTGGQAIVRVEAGISVPRAETLERVEFYRTERLVASFDDFEGEAGPSGVRSVAADVPISGVTPQDFVRVVARLGDGRELEDVELLQGARFQAEIDVQLVQLQVLVVDRSGNPVGDLTPENFEVRENGQRRQVENLYVSNDIPLSLGLAIDSSGSMEPIWRRTNAIAEAFLNGALTWRDQAFLVDFDSTLRLVQPLTGSKPLLARGLERLFPQGQTALYDAILFSLLQYGETPGRRALVVVTDGFDSNSRSDPTRAIDFGKRLGVPVYVVAMRSLGFGPTTMDDANLRNSMRLITGPTGGRLFQIESIDQMASVFDHIEEELRRQYVLTYYSERPFGSAVEPEVRMTQRGLRVRSALPLETIE